MPVRIGFFRLAWSIPGQHNFGGAPRELRGTVTEHDHYNE